VARESGPDGDLRGLEVADFAHHDHIRVLAHDVAQAAGEREADLGIHVDLVHPFNLVLHRVLDGDDLLIGQVDLLERAVERG